MASPLAARSGKSLANLKRGGQKPPSAAKRAQVDESKKIARKLLKDPTYRKILMKRLRTGTIQPGVEALLYYYAYGKPKETVESTQVVPIKIVHQYADDDKKP